MRADLHLHSYFSDGFLSPDGVAQRCRQNGVLLAAVTDHDNMNGCAEFALSCKKYGVTAVRGLEISAYLNDVKLHILGYNVNAESTAYKTFLDFVVRGSAERTAIILNKLKKLGVKLTFADIERERKCSASPYHTMYIARAAARKGHSTSPGNFYAEFLAPGKVAYSGAGRPTPEYALQVIAEGGGISSLAHPGRITLEKDELIALIEKMKVLGLGGIEAVYSGHTEDETAYYKGVAAKYSLLVTGGSDTHYPTGSRSVGTPEFYPSEELLAALNV